MCNSELKTQFYCQNNIILPIAHVILLTILTLRAGGRFNFHFWTQSGAPSPYLAFRAPPRFQAIYGVESVPRFQPIFGIRSAPPPAFKLYMVLKACPPPLSTHIWHSERPPAFKLYMVLRACPAFNPYLAFRAPPAFKLYFVLKAGPYLVFRASEQRGALNAKYGLKAGHALNTIYRFKAEGRSECQIWTWSAALSLKMGVKAPPALDLKFWLRAGAALQSTVR